MPNSFGYRARTRDMFKRGFKQRGMIKLSTFMKPYKVGDYVDIKANGAQQKGMPHKFYHGRTGIIYNVTPRAAGILINKRVGNRFIQKRVNIRVEHIKHSQGRQVFLDRVKENVRLRMEAKEKGETVVLKRTQKTPREAHSVEAASCKNLPQTLNPVPYETTI